MLRARLWDAKFFWDQDRKVPLESRLPALDSMVFHAELGTLGPAGASGWWRWPASWSPHVPGADRAPAERAALLAKADLVTGMVGEFPELQGIMGGHYAAAQGEPAAVADAIREHYAPKGPDDAARRRPRASPWPWPTSSTRSWASSRAGIRPTGSKDPFALRRAGLGVIRLIFENGLRLPLRPAPWQPCAAMASGSQATPRRSPRS